MVNATVCEPLLHCPLMKLKHWRRLTGPAVTMCRNDRVWQHDADYTIRWLYLMASFIGLGIWVVLNPVSLLWRSLFRRKSS
ncbi:hypothetical protein [Klebsiella sp. PL-2018]|uniref:hypothetical protein n=1 Tax=Klebsiella sp. PL-2018 TaxID=2851540 RepID=UPI001C23F48B|nr:hypothetical protein [Klebsiella sp. PL-2018]QXD01225.1 hypothetical protein MKleb_5724 [Klebsiella sp. PL-2018]